MTRRTIIVCSLLYPCATANQQRKGIIKLRPMRFLALIFLCSSTLWAQFIEETYSYNWELPMQVKRCAESLAPLAVSPFKLDYRVNPYYLRGDFDGDGLIDLAIALRGATDDTKRATGICRVKGPSEMRGSLAKGQLVDDGISESVPVMGWTVVSRKAIMAVLRQSKAPAQRVMALRRKLARGRGEILHFPYEDGEGVIFYVDGHSEWYTVNSIEFPQDDPK